jgi:AraC family ethanolamine operon transcriptional activator
MANGTSAPTIFPVVTVEEISDPATTKASIELIDQETVQLQSIPLRARRVTVRLEGAATVYHSSNQRARTYTSALGVQIAYVAFGSQASGSVNGLPIRAGLILAVESATEVTFVVDAGWESVAFLVDPGEVREHLAALQRDADFRMQRGVEFLQADPEQGQTLFDWGKRLTETAIYSPDLFNQGERDLGAVRVELLETLLATIGRADDFESHRHDRTLQEQSRIVRSAEKYALSHIDDHPYVSDLCRATGVSERALEMAFTQTLGLPPVAYLTRLRLHRVRQALLAAKPWSDTVSAIALDWGFWHFGEFSRIYKDCFGELPSDTLRRAPPEDSSQKNEPPP